MRSSAQRVLWRLYVIFFLYRLYYRLYCGLFLLNFPHIRTSIHTSHTHTNISHSTQHTLMQSSLICSLACRGILFALSVSVALIKEICQIQTLVNVFHSPVKQFVCYLGSQLSLHLSPALPSLSIVFVCFVTVYSTWTPLPSCPALRLVLANHIVCSTEISQFNEFYFSFSLAFRLDFYALQEFSNKVCAKNIYA